MPLSTQARLKFLEKEPDQILGGGRDGSGVLFTRPLLESMGISKSTRAGLRQTLH